MCMLSKKMPTNINYTCQLTKTKWTSFSYVCICTRTCTCIHLYTHLYAAHFSGLLHITKVICWLMVLILYKLANLQPLDLLSSSWTSAALFLCVEAQLAELASCIRGSRWCSPAGVFLPFGIRRRGTLARSAFIYTLFSLSTTKPVFFSSHQRSSQFCWDEQSLHKEPFVWRTHRRSGVTACQQLHLRK